MTQTELEQLSRDVAKKRGCDTYKLNDIHPIHHTQHDLENLRFWLHQDSAFCFELMVSERIKPINFEHNVIATIYQENAPKIDYIEYYNDYDWDENLATRVAILKAYLAKI